MVRGKWLACALVVAVAAGAAVAMADADKTLPPTRSHHGWALPTPLGELLTGQIGRLMVLRSDLNVAEQQRAEMKKVLVSHKAEVVSRIKSLWQKRQALRDAVLAEKIDEPAIRRAADSLGRAIGDAAVLGARIKAKVAPILTSEQKELIQKFRAESDQATEKFLGQLDQARAAKSKGK